LGLAQRPPTGPSYRLPVEGKGVFASDRAAAALDQAISKVGVPPAKRPQCLRNNFRSLKSQFLTPQNRLQDLLNFVLPITVGDRQYPN
jgi:hypothetical protein